MTIGAAGSAGSLITICPGVDASHNGIVFIDGQNTRTFGIKMNDYNRVTGGVTTNLVLTNYVSSLSDRDVTGGAGIWGGSHGFMDSLELVHCMNGIYCNGLTKVVVSNSYLHDIQGDVGIRMNGYGGTDLANYVVHNCHLVNNSDFAGSNGGPDGCQVQNGLTFYSNIWECVNGTVLAGQHPDGIQAQGSYHLVYGNYFANWINSAFKPGPIIGLGYTTWQESYFYNNVVVNLGLNTLDKGCEAGPDSTTVNNVTNVWIVNNTFVDIDGLAITAGVSAGATVISNFVIENNGIYNCGRNASATVITFDNNSLATGWTIDRNAINAGSDGGTTITKGGSGYSQTHTSTGVPAFVSYTLRTSGNDYHLKSTDTAYRAFATPLTAIFTIDKDNNTRSAWDAGSYEFQSQPPNRVTTFSFGVATIGRMTSQ